MVNRDVWFRPAAGLFLLAASFPLQAEHFEIRLLATGPDGATQKAYADQTPPLGGLNPRPVLRVHPGDPITAQFIMTSLYPHGFLPNVGVHYYVAREEKLGQKAPPSLEQGLITENTLTFDLKPKARIGARFRFAVTEPGLYLLRVESQRTQRGHEHFSALDLEVR